MSVPTDLDVHVVNAFDGLPEHRPKAPVARTFMPGIVWVINSTRTGTDAQTTFMVTRQPVIRRPSRPT